MRDRLEDTALRVRLAGMIASLLPRQGRGGKRSNGLVKRAMKESGLVEAMKGLGRDADGGGDGGEQAEEAFERFMERVG